jgi:ComF family protein
MSFFQRLLQAIPFECAICKRWPSNSFEGVSGICQLCIQKHAKAPQFPLPQGLDACAAALSFEAPWSALIATYKFAPEPGLARIFAGVMLRDERIRKLLECADIVMPLPLATERLEERGFNQALALAKHLVVKNKIDSSSLIRTRNTAPQRTLDRAARQRNVANAFAVPSDASIKGKDIVLIDDVMTTGATLAAAAAPLRKAGAQRIYAVVIAQTPLAHVDQPL